MDAGVSCPEKPGGELLTQEPSPMLGKYHSGQEKLQQAWSFTGWWLHAPSVEKAMVSGIISLLVTLVSPWRRNASSGQISVTLLSLMVPVGVCSGWCPLEAAQSSHLPHFSLEQLRQTDINRSPLSSPTGTLKTAHRGEDQENEGNNYRKHQPQKIIGFSKNRLLILQ